MALRQDLVDVEFQNYIPESPITPQGLYNQACMNDRVTVDAWKPVWKKNVLANKKRFGSFKDHGIQKIFGLNKNGVGIVAGAGPSLKHNAHLLRERKGVMLTSCLHNFHYLEDKEANVDFYVSLDAGNVTVEEVTEGGARDANEYWEMTKNRVLLCYVATDPELLAKWKGEILFFNCPVPDDEYEKFVWDTEPFQPNVSSGGNVLGACVYINKGWLGAFSTVFVGADFCFDNTKFHSWDSKYDDKLGVYMTATNVFGNRVKTWTSYHNFKCWFDSICQTVPSSWINCTEGGTLGAYNIGNIEQIRQMTLKDALFMFSCHDHLRDQAMNPDQKNKVLLF